MNILVTGGAGYIGSHFINKLRVDKNVNVIVVDSFLQGRSNIIDSENIRYFELNLINKSDLKNIFENNHIDMVAHFAALASVPDSISKPIEYYSNNIIGGLNLVDLMVEHKVDKIIFSSSASVYGEPIMERIEEDHPKNPTNPYGYTKAVFEKVLRDYYLAYGLKSVSFRYFCAAGCDESGLIGEYHNPETHVIPMIIKTALGERVEFNIYGNDYPTPDGTGIRDYIHVNDIAGAHLLALDKLINGADLCESFNLGINQGFSVLELIKATEKISGKKISGL